MLGSPESGVPVMLTRAARRRRLWMPLLVAVVVAAIVLLVVFQSSGKDRVVGAGSTLAQPLVERTAVEYRNANSTDSQARGAGQKHSWVVDDGGSDWVVDGNGFEYEPVGSTGGIMRLEAEPEVDFAVSDYPLSAPALDDKGLIQFPIAIGSVGVVHNLPLEDGQVLRLHAKTVADIYLGDITTWDDPALSELNPDLDLPDLPITPVHRTDGSGSTFVFSHYLARDSTQWAEGPGAGSALTWPTGEGAERSSGLLSAVNSKQGAIGYVEPTQARQAGLGIAEISNGAGTFVAPTSSALAAASAAHDWSSDPQFTEPISPSDDPGAYPMTTAIYALLRSEAGNDTRRVLGFLSFLMDDAEGTAANLGYLPLPATAAEAVRATWQSTFDLPSARADAHR